MPEGYFPASLLSFFSRCFTIHKLFMYICPMYSKELIKGTLKPIILNLLKENERMYGYEITQKVKELTRGKIEITEGALYPALHKLEAEGIVETETKSIGNRIRKYYRLTRNGNSVATEKINELSDFLATLRMALNLPKTTV